MFLKASHLAWLALGAPLLLAAAPARAQPAQPAKPAKPLTGKAKAAADKAAADKAAADKAAADKAAADAAAAADKAAADKAAADAAAADQAAADKAAADKAAAARVAVDDNDPYEDPNKTYRFIGLRYRDAIAPKFIMNWFANGGANVNVPMVGPEFITRRDHLEIAVALMYADYSMNPTLFQSKTDPATSWDLIASSLKLGYVMVDIMYEIPLPFDDKREGMDGRFALLVGGGVGIAGVFGTLYRAEAFPNSMGAASNPANPSQWSACTGPGQTGGYMAAAYCTTRGGNTTYYAGSATNIYAAPTNSRGTQFSNVEANWANGGSLPVVFPWLAVPQIAFRYKPIKQFQLKADFGFSDSGFFFGLSASAFIPSSSTASPPPPPPSSGGGEK
jgi:hypothetical protein